MRNLHLYFSFLRFRGKLYGNEGKNVLHGVMGDARFCWFEGITGQREIRKTGAVAWPAAGNAITRMGVNDECTYYRNRKRSSEKDSDKF